MMKEEWKQVKHKLVRNRGMRYVQLEIDETTKVIVDISPTFYGLLSFPKIHSWQKFDIYRITSASVAFYDESFLVNKKDIEKSEKLARKARVLPPLAVALFSASGLSAVIRFQFMQNIPLASALLLFGIAFISLRLILYGWLIKRNFLVLENKDFDYKKRAIALKVKKRPYVTFLNIILQMIGLLFLAFSNIFPPNIFLAAITMNLACLLNGAIPIGAEVYIKLNDKKEKTMV